MTQARRVKLSAVQRSEMWNRWKAGQSLHEIGRALGKDHVVVQFLLARHGGIAPPTRRREVTRHGGRPQYRANDADRLTVDTARRRPLAISRIEQPQAIPREISSRSARVSVRSERILDWSPEQISGWLKNQYPQDGSLRVSHETIYRSLFIQARGVLKQELIQHLRTKRRIRRSRHSRVSGHHSRQIVDAISIRERPAEAEDRAVPGHWEGDLLSGAHNSHVATLVERHSRFVMLVQVPSKETATVVAALSRHVRQLPATLRRSLTWDRGLEMAQHQSFTVATDVKVYFCDPQSPWQRGSNENTNGLLRQYLPKKADLSSYSQSDLDRIALRLKQRPRKTLGFETPESRLQASVASTP
jgi:IS30 family transposase